MCWYLNELSCDNVKGYRMRKPAAIVFIILAAALSIGMLLAGCEDADRAPAQDIPLVVEEEEEPEPAPEEPEANLPPPEPEPPGPTDLELFLETLNIGFGFTDEDGLRILLSWPEDFEETYIGFDPKEYTLAIGPYGDVLLINYDGLQWETEENNNRYNAANFENLPGHVYRTANKLLSSNRTYVLTIVGPLNDRMLALYPPANRRGNTPPMEEETIESIEIYKDRKVEWGKILATTRDALVGIVLYEQLGDDMLFSIIYIDETKALFWDCPAIYDEVDTWRTGNGSEPGAFGPLFLARFEEGLALLLTWGAKDGESLVLLYEKDDAFVQWEGIDYTRYW